MPPPCPELPYLSGGRHRRCTPAPAAGLAKKASSVRRSPAFLQVPLGAPRAPRALPWASAVPSVLPSSTATRFQKTGPQPAQHGRDSLCPVGLQTGDTVGPHFLPTQGVCSETTAGLQPPPQPDLRGQPGARGFPGRVAAAQAPKPGHLRPLGQRSPPGLPPGTGDRKVREEAEGPVPAGGGSLQGAGRGIRC